MTGNCRVQSNTVDQKLIAEYVCSMGAVGREEENWRSKVNKCDDGASVK